MTTSEHAWRRVLRRSSPTLRHSGKLLHLGIGRAHSRTEIIALIHNNDATIANQSTGAFWIAIPAYAVAGVANSLFFAATLAARSEYAPPEARGQVFVWVGALKIAAGSAATAFAGAIIATTLHAPLLIAIVITLLAASGSVLDRTRRRGTSVRWWRSLSPRMLRGRRRENWCRP